MTASVLQAAGFTDAVHEAQQIFRAVLEALARPTMPQRVRSGILPPAPLGALTGAVLLTMCDEQTPVWLDPALRRADEVTAWLRFHTAAPLVDDAGAALFCVASCPTAMPELDELAQGTDEDPHRSATVIVDAAGARPSGRFIATGPGVDGQIEWDGAGLPGHRAGGRTFLQTWAANTRRFPRGVDVILAGDDDIRALPRTTTLTEVH